MAVVVLLDVGGLDLDGGVLCESEGNHHEIDVGRVVVLCNRPLKHQRILDVALVEEGTVFCIVLLGSNGSLDVIPVSFEPAGCILGNT